MSPKPERARPALRSTLVPEIEPINTGLTSKSRENHEAPVIASIPTAPTKTTSSAVTVKIQNDVISRAKSAVLHTAGQPGGHKSFAALVQAAVEREVQRLADEFNEGQPYGELQGEFRRGRPFG